MKLFIKIILSIVFLSSYTITYAFSVDGIEYEIWSSNTECGVKDSNSPLTGSVIIPSTVTDNGTTYTVKSIIITNSPGMTSISIPETVISISIYEAYNLKEINVNSNNANYSSVNGVLFNKSKDEIYQFPSGSEVTAYTIPSSVVNVNMGSAFRKCANLTSLTIPSTVTSLGASASNPLYGVDFSGCISLKEINVSANNASYSSVNGVLYDKSGKTLLSFPKVKDSSSFTIPNGITLINDYAFAGNTNLTSVTLSNTVEEIGKNAFENCTNLSSFTLTENLKEIGQNAFAYCTFESLYYNASNLKLATNGGWGAFRNCTIKKLYIGDTVENFPSDKSYGGIKPEDGIYVSDLSSWCKINFETNPLNSCNKLYVDGSLLSLKNISIPSGVTQLGKRIFYNCSEIENISIPNSVTHIGEEAFYGISAKNIDIPNSVTYIGNASFRGVSFDNLTIPENVTYIGDSFGYTTHLNFNAINCTECQGFYNIESITIGDKVKKIPNKFLRQNEKITELSIPKSVSHIGDEAFYYMQALKELTIPQSVEYIGNSIINLSYIETLILEANISTVTQDQFGSGSGNSYLKKLIIKSPITSIGAGTFSLFSALEEVQLPITLKTIGNGAFAQCSKLKEIIIPDGVEYIPFQSLAGCGFTTVTLPKNLTQIGSMAFYSNNNLTSLIARNPIPSEFIKDFPANFQYTSLDYFSNYSKCTLYVPQGSLEAYQAADVWKKFTNIVEYQPTEIHLIDGEDFTNDKPIQNVTVTYSRNYPSTGWQALYLPFDMTYDEWADYGIVAKLNNVHQYDTDDDGVLDKTTIEYNRVTSGNIRANTPYVFKPYASGEITFSCEDRTVFAAPTEDAHVDCSTTEMLYTIYGNFQTKTGLKGMDAYALSPDGAFVQAKTDSQALKPYRIYLIITPRTDGGYTDTPLLRKPERVDIVVDGETTSIEDLIINVQENGVYYDLQGRPVLNPTTGIYILNGQKVFIK